MPQNRPNLRQGSWRLHNSHTSVTEYAVGKPPPGDHRFPATSGSLRGAKQAVRKITKKQRCKNYRRGSEWSTNIHHVTTQKFPITSHRNEKGQQDEFGYPSKPKLSRSDSVLQSVSYPCSQQSSMNPDMGTGRAIERSRVQDESSRDEVSQ